MSAATDSDFREGPTGACEDCMAFKCHPNREPICWCCSPDGQPWRSFGLRPKPDVVLPTLTRLLQRRPELGHRGFDWDRTSLAGVLFDSVVGGC